MNSSTWGFKERFAPSTAADTIPAKEPTLLTRKQMRAEIQRLRAALIDEGRRIKSVFAPVISRKDAEIERLRGEVEGVEHLKSELRRTILIREKTELALQMYRADVEPQLAELETLRRRHERLESFMEAVEIEILRNQQLSSRIETLSEHVELPLLDNVIPLHPFTHEFRNGRS